VIRTRHCLPLWLACVACTAAPALADEVRFDGASTMVGELKRLERGRLSFKTDGTGTITIDWTRVDIVKNAKTLEIELSDGTLLYGTLDDTEEAGKVMIHSVGGDTDVPIISIVRMSQIEEELLDRFDGSANAGINVTRSNDYRSTNLGVSMTYRTKKYYSSLDVNALTNQSKGADPTRQASLQLRGSRLFQNRWNTGALLKFEHNEDLGIDLRSSIGYTVGKTLARTNRNFFLINAGLVYTQERVSDTNETTDSQEVTLGFDWQVFRFDDPELDLSTQMSVIPSLSQSGRVRGYTSITLRWEIVGDLYWRLSFVDNYDSDPPSTDALNNDYTLTSGISYDF
jgi:Protein of unknown function, DUF481